MSRRKSRAARLAALKTAAVLILVAVLVVVFLVVFRLRTVYVRGNMHNAPDEVTALLLERPCAENTILTKLLNTKRKIETPGFIESIDTEILGRDTLRVLVTERTFVGCVPAGAYWWYFDASWKGLANAPERTAGEYVPSVEGLTLRSDPEIGSYLPVMNTRMFSMLAMLRARVEMNPNVFPDKAVFDEEGNMSLIYGPVTVLMGNGEKMELRLKQLAGVIEELLGGAYEGTLHLENYDGSQAGLIFDKT